MNRRMADIEKELALLRLKETLPKVASLNISDIHIEHDSFRQIWTIKQKGNILKLKVYVTLEEPYVGTMEGKLTVNFEESMNINPLLQQWRSNVPKIIYARFLDRVLRTCINLSKLYIETKQGYKAIAINIDVYSLIEEGTICDLALAGINRALQNVDINFEGTVVTDWFQPATMVTMYVMTEKTNTAGENKKYKIFTEPDRLGKDCAEVELLIAVGKDKFLKGVQKLKPNLLEESAFLQCLQWAVTNSKKLFLRHETKI